MLSIQETTQMYRIRWEDKTTKAFGYGITMMTQAEAIAYSVLLQMYGFGHHVDVIKCPYYDFINTLEM